MSLLKISGLNQRFGEKLLYEEADFELNLHEHAVLVGPNGIGKSTLIKIMTGEMEADAGKVAWDEKVRVGYLDQYAKLAEKMSLGAYLREAYQDLYDLNADLNANLAELETAYNEKLLKKVLQQQRKLQEAEFEKLDLRIRRIAAGLGLMQVGLERKIGEISGGQRVKLILAKLLLENPEVILLDEPTNFLDKEHVAWLADYLQKFAGAFFLISHDMDFVNKIAQEIVALEKGKLRKYRGNYDAYCRQRELEQMTQKRAYDKQQKMIAKTETYIAKNGVRTATAKQAQSRQKMLNRLVRVEAPTEKQTLTRFSFGEVSALAGMAVETENLLIGYDKALLPPINWQVRAGEKVVITGFNGIGKSTLLKTMLGQLPALAGKTKWARGAVVNYFEQDLKWQDPLMTPLQVVWLAFPELTQSQVRARLAQAGVKKELVNSRLASLSGGEQAKVKLTLMMLKKSNVLILDEPTNHLDTVAKEALQKAIQDFTGTVILVSHEKSFYQAVASRNLRIDDKEAEFFCS